MKIEEIWKIIGPQQNRTKCPFHRVLNAYNFATHYISSGIAGDFVECGVWKGGVSSMFGALCEWKD